MNGYAISNIGGISTDLGSLSDVDTTTAANNAYLMYQDGTWYPNAISLTDYVTLDTAQTVTGQKTFSALQTFNAGVTGTDAALAYVLDMETTKDGSYAMRGYGNSSSANGVRGQASASGIGVQGVSVSGNGGNFNSTSGNGVYAITQGSGADDCGVYGVVNGSSTGIGVFGRSFNTNGIGVKAQTNGSNPAFLADAGSGVAGQFDGNIDLNGLLDASGPLYSQGEEVLTSASGVTISGSQTVTGAKTFSSTITCTNSGTGLTATATVGNGVTGTGANFGVAGTGSGTTGTGIYGTAGHTISAGGGGVVGLNTATTGSGVYGETTSDGAGVYGKSNSGSGVTAESTSGPAITIKGGVRMSTQANYNSDQTVPVTVSHVFVDADSNDVTLTFTVADGQSWWVIAETDPGANTVTLQGASGNINGAASNTTAIDNQWDAKKIYCNGTDFFIWPQ
jgi:hypothetical protein